MCSSEDPVQSKKLLEKKRPKIPEDHMDNPKQINEGQPRVLHHFVLFKDLYQALRHLILLRILNKGSLSKESF